MKVPEYGSTVVYKGDFYTVKTCNFGGKCSLKKIDPPHKGKIITNIDISELNK